MARFEAVDPAKSTGEARELLEGVRKSTGMVPNLMRQMAISPAVLGGYLGLSGALGGGTLDAGLRERIALAVAQYNGCEYCLAAHSAIGKRLGPGGDEILAPAGSPLPTPRSRQPSGSPARSSRAAEE